MITRYGNVNNKSSSIATFRDIASLNINSNIYINIDLDLRQPTPNFRSMLNFWFTPTNAKFQTQNNSCQILDADQELTDLRQAFRIYVWSITPTNTWNHGPKQPMNPHNSRILAKSKIKWKYFQTLIFLPTFLKTKN